MKKGIDTFTLKMIAIVTMLIDHIGFVLLPQYEILRIIGRISFPIFAYTLVEGFIHTRDVKKYLIRLGTLALISEIPFDMAFFGGPLVLSHQNVFFTLFLGILMLLVLNRTSNVIYRTLGVLGTMLLADFLCTDYGWLGLLMILWYYVFRDKKWIKYAGIAAINIFLMGYTQAYAPLALIPIAMHNGEQGIKCKKFFYGFYPVHLVVLYLLNLIL